MPPVVTQEAHIVQFVQPIGIVGHDGTVRGIAEGQVLVKHRADACHVRVDLVCRQQLTRLVFARRVADLGRAAPHQGNRPVTSLLQPAQKHDLDERADMQAVGRHIKADIPRKPTRFEGSIKTFKIRAVRQIPAGLHHMKEFRCGLVGHGRARLSKNPGLMYSGAVAEGKRR